MKMANRFNSLRYIWHKIRTYPWPKIRFGIHPSRAAARTLIFFPYQAGLLCCGIAGIVAFKGAAEGKPTIDIEGLTGAVQRMAELGINAGQIACDDPETNYLGGRTAVTDLLVAVRRLKQDNAFYEIYGDEALQAGIKELARHLAEIDACETRLLAEQSGNLSTFQVDAISATIEDLRDIVWCLNDELLDNIGKITNLVTGIPAPFPLSTLAVIKKANAVLNSIDRLEVRGRDSAGFTLMFVLDEAEYHTLEADLEDGDLREQFDKRLAQDVLINRGINRHVRDTSDGGKRVALSLTYKVAAEVGSLGDNVAFLRDQLKSDPILHLLLVRPHLYQTITSHTRWASVGAITEANCHPVDNKCQCEHPGQHGIILAALNGDIDNFQQLRAAFEESQALIPEDITTDTKIIPLQIEKHLSDGRDVQEAFRLAVNDFEGSHAISMQTDLAPGKVFLAQKGSGQAIFVGIAADHYMPSSEIYGLVEETSRYIKLNGEKVFDGPNGPTQGQIVILDQESAGGLQGLTSMYYDGTRIRLTEEDVNETAITSRDIDRQDYPHYFLKEITESPVSVEKTLQNRWKIKSGHDHQRYVVTLDETVVTPALQAAICQTADDAKPIRRILFVGQGTAGVAALACATIVEYYLDDPTIQISAMKSSELSGFKLIGRETEKSMADTLVIAISQSGTTTDTNKTVDMVRERGAHTIAIVNRRDSDITFKVDGVMYTSSGRDIEMSVASTKAFYSQIVAGAILGLFFAQIKGRRSDHFIADEINQLLALPDQMRSILASRDKFEASARRLAVSKTYWAAVGSGPNKASADEIRIKLSELCYKTISSDYVEDKKHIDLSAEPLIIVCAAGTGGTVIGDIIKDTAIFHAHKAAPVVIADEGEKRFDAYAKDVFHVPMVRPHLAPLVNTLVGHIWGYYAALAINEGSHYLYSFREDLKQMIADYAGDGLKLLEFILEKSFREKIASFYNEFRRRKANRTMTTAIGLETVSDLTLLLKYLSGKLPVSDFELDFGAKGTAVNMLNVLFNCLAKLINEMARPVDAIKHQAKTVTVGTSRITEKLRGVLFDSLENHGLQTGQLINRNIVVIKNLQPVVAEIAGSTLYRIRGLNLLGEPTDESTIEVMRKTGTSLEISSRVESDDLLKGTKRIIVRRGNVYIGKGIKDGRSMVVAPIISTSPDTPNLIEHLLLWEVKFNHSVPLPIKVKALGGKFEHIKNIVQENSIPWQNTLLEQVPMVDLFGHSAEKIGETIVSQVV